jgi:DNA-binding CsgD family transcriptional regulator
LCQAAAAASGSAVTEADIQPAIDAHLVWLEGDRVVFRHPLIAAAVYQSLTVGDRQRIHRALAEVTPAGDDRRIWHLAAAVLGPDDVIAAELEVLAERAARRGAVTVSITALDRAAALVTDKPRQADLMLRSSELAVELGRGQVALDLLARTDTGQLEPFGHARMLVIREAVRPGLASDGAPVADLVAAARDTQAAGDGDLAASVLWTAASRCWWTSAGPPERLAVVEAVQALGLPTTDPRRIAILSYTVAREHRPQLRRDLLAASPVSSDLTGLRFMASAADNLGDHALAAELFDAAVRQARRQGRLGVIARLQALHAWAALWSADLDSVAMLAGETQRLGSELSQPMWHGAAVLELGLVSALRGDYLPAKEQLETALGSEEIRGIRLYQAMALYALSVAALGVGRYQDAYEGLRRIVDPADSVSHYGACQWVVGDLAEAAAGAGRGEECAPVIAGLAADLRDHPTPAVRYSVLYADAILAADDSAPARFEAALAADPGGSRLAEGRLQLAYGSWLRRHRRMREARAALSHAYDTFTGLGTKGFAYRATRELHAAGGTRHTPRGDGLPQLTSQELQIAKLAARGLSNRQIGEQLFLSHRTVGSHLYHLFPKLGITTRAQLADALK